MAHHEVSLGVLGYRLIFSGLALGSETAIPW